MEKNVFSLEVERFLGEYKIVEDKHGYGVTHKKAILCKDGRVFEQTISSYGIRHLDPVVYYEEVMKNIKEQVIAAWERSLPYADRKVREIYENREAIKEIAKGM